MKTSFPKGVFAFETPSSKKSFLIENTFTPSSLK